MKFRVLFDSSLFCRKSLLTNDGDRGSQQTVGHPFWLPSLVAGCTGILGACTSLDEGIAFEVIFGNPNPQNAHRFTWF